MDDTASARNEPLRRRSDWRAGALLVFAVVLLMSFPAFGQFGRSATRSFSGRVNFEDKRKGHGVVFGFDVSETIRTTWNEVRPALTKAGLDFLNERDIGSGFRTSRSAINLAETGTLYFGTDGTGITLRYVLPNNRIETSLRVPGPSPSSTDPRAYAICNADVTIDIDRSGSDLVASPARLKWNCSRPQGLNLTGKAVVAFNNFLAALGGPDFVGTLTGPIRNGNLAVSSKVLLKVNKMLPTKRQGGVFAFGSSGNAINLTLEEDGGRPIVH